MVAWKRSPGFQQIMVPYQVQHLRAVATSAVREAANADLFVERVFLATGISVEVLSSSEQNRLIYSAVQRALKSDHQPIEEDMLISELGSGSLELALFREGQVAMSGSFSLGSIRLRNAIRPTHRSLEESLELMARLIRSSIDSIEHNYSLGDVPRFVIVGGDARFAADRIAKKIVNGAYGKTVPKKELVKCTT